MKRVDVAIPCYGYAHFLRECVANVLRQERVEVRVLILDDASLDATPGVAAALVAEDARIAYRRHAINLGLIETFNAGLGWAEAEYFLLLSADDVLTPGALERAVELMEKCPGMGVAFGESIVTEDPSRERYDPPARYSCLQFNPDTWIERFCRSGHNIVGNLNPTALVRTAVQKKCGHYRAELPHSGDMEIWRYGDMEIWMRMGLYGRVGMVGAKQAYYRQHPGAWHHRYAGVPDLRQRRDAFECFFREHGHQVPGAERLHQMARCILARKAMARARQAFASVDPAAGREYVRFASETP